MEASAVPASLVRAPLLSGVQKSFVLSSSLVVSMALPSATETLD